MRYTDRQEGAVATEYAILLFTIVVILVAAMEFIGVDILGMFNDFVAKL